MDETQPRRGGRPRSERAREAVLNAVDDLLVEEGYAAMTMKGIAERAGVGRQTVYRWWSTKAEILWEASVIDARDELAVPVSGDQVKDLNAYLVALVAFLTRSPAGAAYRALLGEAQHDTEVAALIATQDVLGDSARRVLDAHGRADAKATALLVGPAVYWTLIGKDPKSLPRAAIVDAVTAYLAAKPGSRRTQ